MGNSPPFERFVDVNVGCPSSFPLIIWPIPLPTFQFLFQLFLYIVDVNTSKMVQLLQTVLPANANRIINFTCSIAKVLISRQSVKCCESVMILTLCPALNNAPELRADKSIEQNCRYYFLQQLYIAYIYIINDRALL